MAIDSKVKEEHKRLLMQQLQTGEKLDGIFASGPDLTVAITSDRLMLVSPAVPNGWRLKSIPWRLLWEILPETSDDAAVPAEPAVHLGYSIPDRPGSRKVERRDLGSEPAPAEKPAAPRAHDELSLLLTPRNDRMADLLRARISGHLPPP